MPVILIACFLLYLIEILHQTTTIRATEGPACRLYLIEILHQTTTLRLTLTSGFSCILSKFYIKPQLPLPKGFHVQRCILSKFYIKPQLPELPTGCTLVVSYRNSTSNHNGRHGHGGQRIVVSYRNSTSNHNGVNATMSGGSVVSYRNSTSNHNSAAE